MEAAFLLDVFSLNSLISRSLVSRDSANTHAQEKQTEKHCVQTSYFLLCVCSLCCSKVVPTISSSNHFRALHLGLYINCILVSICCNIEGCIRALQNYLGKKRNVTVMPPVTPRTTAKHVWPDHLRFPWKRIICAKSSPPPSQKKFWHWEEKYTT